MKPMKWQSLSNDTKIVKQDWSDGSLVADTQYTKLILYGGAKAQGGVISSTNSEYEFSLSSTKWTEVTPSNAPTSYSQRGTVKPGNLQLIYGGQNSSRVNIDIYINDLTKHTWRTMSVAGPKPACRFSHLQLALETSNLLFIFGGGSFDGCGGMS